MRQSNAALRLAEVPPAPVRKRKEPTAWVGAFLILALVTGLGLLFTMTDAALFRGRYVVTTHVPDAAGIRKGDPVRLRGVNIGRVLGFELEPEGVAVRLEIEGEYELPSDSRVELRSGGLLGGTVAEVVPGTASETLGYGDALPGTSGETFGDATGKLVDGAEGVLGQARALLSDAAIDDVHGSAAELRSLLVKLSTAVVEQRSELETLMASLIRSAEGIERTASGPELVATAQRLERVAAQAQLVTASLDRSSRSLETVLARIERGEGTLGKLTTDAGLYDDLRGSAQSIRRTSDQVSSLVAAIEKDPRRYFKFSVF